MKKSQFLKCTCTPTLFFAVIISRRTSGVVYVIQIIKDDCAKIGSVVDEGPMLSRLHCPRTRLSFSQATTTQRTSEEALARSRKSKASTPRHYFKDRYLQKKMFKDCKFFC